MKVDFEERLFVGNLIGKLLLVRTLMGSVLFSLLFTISQAQTVRQPLSARSVFPNAYSLKVTDAFSFTANQAALANTATLTGGFYGERRFLLQELAFYRAVFCVPTSSGQFGFTGIYSGYSNHHELLAGLAYGRKLGGKVDVGAQFNYQVVKIAGYGSASTVFVEAGTVLHLDKQTHIGIHVSNPTSSQLGKDTKDLLPSVYTVGVGYEVSPQVFVGGEVQKTLHKHVVAGAGMQYRFDDRLWARAGFRSAGYYLGIGVGIKDLRLDATINVHPQLGVTPGLQVIFHQKKKES